MLSCLCTIATRNLSRMRKLTFQDRLDTNWPVKAQKQASSSKFCILVEETLYYPCSENKGADLRLCFRIGKYPVFSRCGSYVVIVSMVVVSSKTATDSRKRLEIKLRNFHGFS